MKVKCLFSVIVVIGFINVMAADSPTSSIPAIDATKVTQMDPDLREMIDTWQKGSSTNGLFCALQVIRSKGSLEVQPVCNVNVVNDTTNMYHSFLNLPREVLFQIDLIDSDEKPVDKSSEGKLFEPWTQKQISQWFQQQLQARRRGAVFPVFPFNCTKVNNFSIPELFRLKTNGEYTLHLRMQLMEYKPTESDKMHIDTISLPEVVATVQIRADDIIRTKIQQNTQTIK